MMTNNEINARVTELRRLEAEAEQLKQAAEQIRTELKAELDSRKAEEVNTGLHKVIYKAYTQNRVDTQKLKDEGIYSNYLKEGISLKFMITDVKIV